MENHEELSELMKQKEHFFTAGLKISYSSLLPPSERRKFIGHIAEINFALANLAEKSLSDVKLPGPTWCGCRHCQSLRRAKRGRPGCSRREYIFSFLSFLKRFVPSQNTSKLWGKVHVFKRIFHERKPVFLRCGLPPISNHVE